MSGSKLSSIQCLRGIAALMVLFFHANETSLNPYPALFSFGQAGVDVFFVISGFIIYHVHQSDLGRPQQFFRYLYRRFTRIYPPYWIITALVLAAALVKPGMVGAEKLTVGAIFESFCLIPFGMLPFFPILPVGWTLFYEMAFYLAFALGILLPRKAFLPLMALWSLSALVASLLAEESGHSRFFVIYLSPHIFEFMAGMGIAWYWKKGFRPGLSSKVLWLALALVFALMLLGPAVKAKGWISSPLMSVLYCGTIGVAFLIAALISDSGNIKFPSFLLLLGNASYSIYLTHFPLIMAANKVAPHAGIWFYAPVAIFLGILFYVFVEKPVMQKLH